MSIGDKPCPFCMIARGETSADIVLADQHTVAFLDRRPLFPGHALLIPRLHYETLADLPAELLVPLFRAAQVLARAIEDGMGAEGTFIGINNHVSQSVPHLHVHIVPRRRKDGLKGFFWPRTAYPDDDAAHAAADAIRGAIEGLHAD